MIFQIFCPVPLFQKHIYGHRLSNLVSVNDSVCSGRMCATQNFDSMMECVHAYFFSVVLQCLASLLSYSRSLWSELIKCQHACIYVGPV